MTVITEEGGFIGAKPDWIGKRSGVWSLQDQYDLQKIYGWPIPLGTEMAGGYYAGTVTYNTFDYTGNLRDYDTWLLGSSTPSYHLILAPKSSGESATTLQHKTSRTCNGFRSNLSAASAFWDGYHNTYSSDATGSTAYPAFNFCENLSINGYSDWYLPAGYELEAACKNLLSLPDWQPGGSEEFELSGSSWYNGGIYWSSRGGSCEDSSGGQQIADTFYFNTSGGGNFLGGLYKTETCWVRAIRRIPYPS